MKNNYSLANTILGLGLSLGTIFGGLTFLASIASAADKGNTHSKYGVVSAVRKGTTPKVSITVKGTDDWKVNTEYNAKVVIGDTELRKADGLYKDINTKGDKAAEVSWHTESMAKSGTAKLVFCNSTSCTAPTTIDFSVTTR